ncbi:MAG: TonB-dependent receptor plug domain-containing protein [Verrucomicrobiota bacterium]
MTTSQTKIRLLSLLVPVFLNATSVFSQTAAPLARADAEVVQLDAFEVKTDENRGYTASETMTGSRVKTQIIDLPYQVNVITSEFLEDFGLFELSDNITQIGGFTGLDVGGNFVLRGFISSNQLRDGFFRLGRYGSSNIDRIEIIKGPSAAIYGRSSPGGMMNMISKMPKSSESQKFYANYGGYGTQRVSFEATGPLLHSKLGDTNYIVTASNYQRDFGADWTLMRNKEYYMAIDHKFSDSSKLTFMAEYFYQERHSPLAPAPVIIDKKGTGTTTTLDSDDVAVGYAYNLGRVNAYGPNSHLNRGNTAFTAIYEKNFNSVFSGRFSANRYAARRDDYNQNNNWGNILINKANTLPNSSARGATPSWGRIYEDGGAIQSDFLAHYWTNNHTLEHHTLFTLDFNDYYRWDPSISYGAATNADIIAWNLVRTVNVDSNYNPIGPVSYFTAPHDAVNGYISTRKMKRRTTVTGALFKQQTSVWDGRLLAYAGARLDIPHFLEHDYLTAASSFTSFIPGYNVGNSITKTMHYLKPNTGLNFKVKDDFRIFANFSQSYFLAQGDNPVDIGSPTYKAETASGWDYGFKGSAFKNRLTYTVSGFYITRQNVSVDDIDPVTGLTVTRRDGDQLVRGAELDATWNITNELFFLTSYGNVNSVYTNFGSAHPQAIGRKVQYVAPYNGSLTLKYSPATGMFKGLSTNAGVTFVGRTPTETPIAGDTEATVNGQRVVSFSSYQWKLSTAPYSIWSLGLRYTLKQNSVVSHTLAFNLNNAFNKDYFRPGTSGATRILQGDKRSVFFTYTLSHK